MEVPSVVAFEVEVVKPYSEYERRQAFEKLEKLRQEFGNGETTFLRIVK
jgi:hypothetical protein